MLKSAVLSHFGTKVRVAAVAGVDPSAVSQWKEYVPERCAQSLADASDGALVYDRDLYRKLHKDRYRNRKGSCAGAKNATLFQKESD